MKCVMQKLKSNSNAELESHIAWQSHMSIGYLPDEVAGAYSVCPDPVSIYH